MNALNVPREISVAADDSGEPLSITSDHGRWQVVRVENRWRIDDEWWRNEISRMYYQLLLSNGSMLTIFKDLLSGMWYQQHY
jgi:hypothetical protein